MYINSKYKSLMTAKLESKFKNDHRIFPSTASSFRMLQNTKQINRIFNDIQERFDFFARLRKSSCIPSCIYLPCNFIFRFEGNNLEVAKTFPTLKQLQLRPPQLSQKTSFSQSKKSIADSFLRNSFYLRSKINIPSL